MKTRIVLAAASVMFLVAAITEVHAQRGRGHNGHNDRSSQRGGNDRDRHDDHTTYGRHDSHHDHHENGHHDRHEYNHKKTRVVHVYNYHHHSPPPPRRVVHYYPTRPRYVYYREYDAYYDCDRQVYITYSGRNWSVSINKPLRMERVDIYRAQRVDVTYYDDDFATYLDQRRPDGRLYAEW